VRAAGTGHRRSGVALVSAALTSILLGAIVVTVHERLGGDWLGLARHPRAQAPVVPADDPAIVATGAAIYAQHCAACHGTDLQGQTNWWKPMADGTLPAPPHDATGHTWQHADAELYELTANGLANVAPPGYRSAMPAFAGTLDADQIHAVIAFIKSRWPAGVRAYQAAQNPGGPALVDLPGDWTYPPSCDLRFGDTAGKARRAGG